MCKRVTTRKIGNKWIVSYGGKPLKLTDTKIEATKKANAKRKSLNRNKR
jgi:hypothetical protein